MSLTIDPNMIKTFEISDNCKQSAPHCQHNCRFTLENGDERCCTLFQDKICLLTSAISQDRITTTYPLHHFSSQREQKVDAAQLFSSTKNLLTEIFNTPNNYTPDFLRTALSMESIRGEDDPQVYLDYVERLINDNILENPSAYMRNWEKRRAESENRENRENGEDIVFNFFNSLFKNLGLHV